MKMFTPSEKVALILILSSLLHVGVNGVVNWRETEPGNRTTSTDEIPVEVQSAQCTITAGDVEASAEASISRKLEGVCGTNHLSRAFGNLEYRLLHELNQLKAMLNLLLPPMYQNRHYFAQPHPALYQPLEPPLPVTTTTTTAKPLTPPSPSINKSTSFTDQVQNESPLAVDSTTQTPQAIAATGPITTTSKTVDRADQVSERILEFRPVPKKQTVRPKFVPKHKTGPRDIEIHRFNNTILSGVDLRIFTYYWRIEHFSQKLKSNVSHISSPIFTISGLHVRVKATLNHLNRDYLYLQLESVAGDAVSDQLNVVLQTGDMFKEIETKVLFKHKIAILDQVTPTSDLISHEFLNTQTGFAVPNSAILSGPYAKDDNILIKIVIFL